MTKNSEWEENDEGKEENNEQEKLKESLPH